MEQTDTIVVPHRRVDLATWARRDHFEFFGQYDEPFFSITADVGCSGLVARCQKEGRSKTLAFWHGAIKAVNSIEEFRYRILDGEPILCDTIHLSSTVLRPDGTFTITFVPYHEDFDEFAQTALEAIAQAKKTTGFFLSPSTSRVDLIHFSTVPWVRFTGLTHARSTKAPGSEPKITLGKFGPGPDGSLSIPVSVTGHHGLMDGVHVGQYLQTLEDLWA